MTKVVEIYTEAHQIKLWNEYAELAKLFWSSRETALDIELWRKMATAHDRFCKVYLASENSK